MLPDLTVATSALVLSLLLCLFAWIAARSWAAILLPACVAVACFCSFLPLGRPIPFSPSPGRYTVLGSKIEVGVAIWILLDNGSGEPKYFRTPYSAKQANALQDAKDGAGENGQVTATIGDEGGVSYDGPPPSAQDLPPKQAEQPAVSIP